MALSLERSPPNQKPNSPATPAQIAAVARWHVDRVFKDAWAVREDAEAREAALLASIGGVLEKWGPHYQGEHAFMVQLARSSRYWRHWSSVATPTLLLAGADEHARTSTRLRIRITVSMPACCRNGVSSQPDSVQPKP